MPVSKSAFALLLVNAKILYFSCPEIYTTTPHYFIIICKSDDENLILSCCTSQQATMQALINRNRFDESTFVYISEHDDQNPFVVPTFVNCNEYFPYTVQELHDMYKKGNLTIHGVLPLDSYLQLITGFNNSKTISVEIKESLPKDENL